MWFRQYSCLHCRNGRRPAAVAATCITATGRRYRLGCLCQQCAVELPLESLYAWAEWHVTAVVSRSTVLELPQLTLEFTGVRTGLSEERSGALVAQLAFFLPRSVQGAVESREREGFRVPPAAAILQRFVLSWRE